jgi:hypothetical protein
MRKKKDMKEIKKSIKYLININLLKIIQKIAIKIVIPTAII